jgi:hypothetical protein
MRAMKDVIYNWNLHLEDRGKHDLATCPTCMASCNTVLGAVPALLAELDRLRAENLCLINDSTAWLVGYDAGRDSTREELDRERAKVAAALALHSTVAFGEPFDRCDRCGEIWPCATARDLGVEEALPDLSDLNVWWRVDVWLHTHAWRFKWAWAWYCNNLERRLTKEEA